MLFEYLKAILVNKNDKLPLDEYVPFLINRWISFSSNPGTVAINDTVNQLGSAITKEQHFKLLLTIFPKMKYMSRVKYIKKVKKETTEEDVRIAMLSRTLEISKKEVKQLLAFTEATT